MGVSSIFRWFYSALICLCLLLIGSTAALACTTADPVILSPAEQNQFALDIYKDVDTIVRVRAIWVSEEQTFIVTETLRGTLKPLQAFTLPIPRNSCSNGRARWLSGGVISFNSKEKDQLFFGYDDEDLIERAIRLGAIKSSDNSIFFAGTIVGLIVFVGLLTILILLSRRRNRRCNIIKSLN
jgi:hypothetical protein